MARTIEKIRFRTTLLRPADGGSWTFVKLPKEASEQIPTRNMITVEGQMNGFPFQVLMQPDSYGGHWFKVEPEIRHGSGAETGDEVEFEIVPATVEPDPVVPDDLQHALTEFPKAKATWDDTTPTARRDWIVWMTQGRKAETRRIRLNKMIDMLAHGKRRVCCFDRSGMASKEFVCPTPADD